MMDDNCKLLIVDDDEDVLLSLNMLLRKHVGAIRVVTDPGRIAEFMDSFAPDVIILDMNFHIGRSNGEEGYRWLDFILKKNPKAVVLFITAYVDTEKVVRAIKAGATDFIPKPWDNAKLLGIVKSAYRLSISRRHPSTSGAVSEAPLLMGECPRMVLLKKQIEKIGATDANVLIKGENGSGKDVVAHMLHGMSARREKPFVTIDLGAVAEPLFESELFGHEKGAFTGAVAAKPGRLETAAGGTVFLDEIGNLSLSSQQKLLTAIEKHQFARVGSNMIRQINVRFITATNAHLPQMVAEGRFRQDLLYRINTFELHVPPLRERGNDIMLLSEFFAKEIASRYKIDTKGFRDDAKLKLMRHTWPGNVRELQHVIERAVILASGNFISADDIEFPETIRAEEIASTLNLETLEREAILKAIDRANGNLSLAASLVGISRYALYRKIEKYGL